MMKQKKKMLKELLIKKMHIFRKKAQIIDELWLAPEKYV